jgi:hypothetical protein
VVPTALRGEKTLIDITGQFAVPAKQVTGWTKQLFERSADVLDGGAAGKADARLDSEVHRITFLSLYNLRKIKPRSSGSVL